jgi:hypothetical protein
MPSHDSREFCQSTSRFSCNVRQILDGEAFVRDGVQGSQYIQPRALRRRFDKQPFKTSHQPHKGGKHKMGGIQKEDGTLASLRFR